MTTWPSPAPSRTCATCSTFPRTKVLFLRGGASQQFAEIPLNLLPEDGVADYIDTGIWSKKAIEEVAMAP